MRVRLGPASIRALEHLGLLLMGTLMGAMLAEAGLRVYTKLDDGALATTLLAWDPSHVLVEPHGRLGYRQRPHSEYRYPNGTVAHANAMGFRGPLVPLPKPEGTFRVVLLGGSATHGWGVEDDETMDAYMRRALRERHPDRTIEVVNLAFDGYDAYQLLERLRTDGLRLEPDLVIINSGINDVRNARFPNLRYPDPRTVLWRHVLDWVREQRRRGRPTLRNLVKHHLYLARLPGVLLHWIGRGEADDWKPTREYYRDAVDHFERSLREIVVTADSLGVPVVLSVPPSSLDTFPSEATSTRSYWLANAEVTQEYRDTLAVRMQRLARQLGSEGFRVSFVKHDIKRRMFLDDAHLTAAGNRAVALNFVEVVDRYLRERAGSGSSRSANGRTGAR